MDVLTVIEVGIGALATVVVAAIAGAIKINRQIETLETKVEVMEVSIKRQDDEYKELRKILEEIRTTLNRLDVQLARNHIE